MAPTQVLLKGLILLQKKHVLDLTDVGADLWDDANDLFGNKVKLQLISELVDPATGSGKTSPEVAISGWFLSFDGLSAGDVKYEIQFSVDSDFGTPGAFLIRNHHPNQFFLKSLTLSAPDGSKIHFPCESWVHNTSKYSSPRVFFRNQVFLPDSTPAGLKTIRENELKCIRGTGEGTRVPGDRIYDYDVYNDLGNPDAKPELKRPVLGGAKLQYPRRIRTGRKPARTGKDLSESWSSDDMYLPPDEKTAKIRSSSVLGDSIKAFAHKIVPAIKTFYADRAASFESLDEIKALYEEGIDLGTCVNPLTDEEAKKNVRSPFTLISELTTTDDANAGLLKYPLPQILQGDDDTWMSNDEFARQTIAGLNPMLITKLETFPPTSSLDPAVFGAQATALTNEHIQTQLQGLTVEQALEKNRLFIVDYHDVFLPYLNIINAQKNKRTYGTRTILFLSNEGTLKIVAIELSLPAPGEKGQRSNRVFLPPTNKKDWLWELAKAHVSVNDAGYHQLVSHWLKTHAIMEPIIIATYRQLSALHPILLLLQPHYKNTMAINARARKALINAGGIIEDCFTTGRYSMEMSAVVYGLSWRFDQEGLPADLIKRKMAVPDPNAKHGLELIIKDYPYAVDGLNIWDAIKNWVTDYTDIFYKEEASVAADTELQSWWHEIRYVGHADKKDADWWLKLDSKKNLVELLTTVIWLASAHHAAVNFGQYAYAGYPANRPTIAHRFVPEPGTKEHDEFLQNPEKFYLSAISSRVEATTVMTTIEILSTHTADEEYLGERKSENWTGDARVLAAFSNFTAAMREVEHQVMANNKNPSLKNRHGAVDGYTLLCINSKPGLTGRGVPNSISI
ncbi:lipoxygenase [Selaginella moellendorffii]|uniref:Lipoxygenase n=1 Tax=Selaginella moellendorffii TaxID=88036 RepID=D8QSL8_SELML|nr:lipoxygenase [Selaginella moellendorffii]